MFGVIGPIAIHGKVAKKGRVMSDGVPQFTTAEYAEKTGGAPCKSCSQSINGAYYQVDGAPTCANCAAAIQRQILKDSHASFVRGTLFGIGGAILGFALYVAFALGTGLVVGYVSLAVGFIVGKAIVMGSGGRGGRRYQIAAVLLTYAAVSLSAVPIYFSQAKHDSGQKHTQTSDATSEPPAEKMSPLKAIGVLALVGLASPFLALSDPLHGLIGLVILFVGIRIAWKLTAGKQISILGPISEPPPSTSI
jgi:hypothetical protein